MPTALTAGRIALAPLYFCAHANLERCVAAPLVVASLACATDFFDGRLARSLHAETTLGARLDVVADGAFVLAAFVVLAWAGRIPSVVPLATAMSLVAYSYALANRAVPRPLGERGLADRAGHLAGVLNFFLIVLASAALLVPWLAAPAYASGYVVALLNLLPIGLRRMARYAG